jgi:release factor glutamine methyltransferase
VLDVGTGSGAVALALKDERPDLEVTASDLSEPALAVAHANGVRLRLDVRWLQADLLAGLPDAFDAVLANLPYVSEADRAGLAPEITRHEPPQALFADADGLAAITALLSQLQSLPSVRVIALEVGAGQAAAVCEMTREAGFRAVRAERDLAGAERVVLGEERAR